MATRATSARSGRKAANLVVAPEALEPAPVVLVVGAEGLLADRAVAAVLTRVRASDPTAEIDRLDAAGYPAGRLAVSTSPSLFGGRRVVILEGVEQANDALATDLLAYLKEPAEEACLVIRHSGITRARPLVEAARATGAAEASCQPLTRDDDKVDFATGEFRRAGRAASAPAVRAVVDAVGSDLRELAAACAQLCTDVDGPEHIDVEHVERYFGGRVEVSGFRVADAAVAGHAEQALVLLRHALATGADPVPLVAAVAMKVRALAKVSAAGRARSADLAGPLGMAPWQIDRARRELSGWAETGLAVAIMAVADADTMVKGGGRDAVYAVERLVMDVAARGREITARPPVRPR